MPNRPALLIMQRHLAPLTAFLEADYTVYRFWEGRRRRRRGRYGRWWWRGSFRWTRP